MSVHFHIPNRDDVIVAETYVVSDPQPLFEQDQRSTFDSIREEPQHVSDSHLPHITELPVRTTTLGARPFLFRMRYHPLTFLRRRAREYGDIVHLRVVNRHIYLLNHPDFVRDVLIVQQRSFRKAYALQRAKRLLGEGLLTNETEFHLQQRRMIQPMFHRRRIAGYGDVIADYATRASDRWQAGETRDIAEEMMRLTLAIVGKTLFNADIEDDADDIGRAMSSAVNNFGRLISPLGDLLDVIPLPATHALHDAEATLETIVMRLIADRRTGGDQGDLLSMLLAVQDDVGAGMSDRQIRDEAMTLLLAGHETTANALTWTWYLLSEHPGAEARLHAEVDRVEPQPGITLRPKYGIQVRLHPRYGPSGRNLDSLSPTPI